MKATKSSFLIIFLSSLPLFVSGQKKVSMDVHLGGVRSGISQHENMGKVDSRATYLVGISVDYRLSERFYLQSGLDFVNKGAKMDVDNFYADPYGDMYRFRDCSESSPKYLQLPLHFGWAADVLGIKLKLSAGPYFAYGIGGKVKIDIKTDYAKKITEGELEMPAILPPAGKPLPSSILRENNLFDKNGTLKRFDGGLGVKLSVEVISKINIALGYDHGLSNVSRNNEYVDYKNRSAFLSIGYKIF